MNYRTNCVMVTERGCVNVLEDIISFLEEHDLKYKIVGTRYLFGKNYEEYLGGGDPYCGGSESILEDDVYAQDIIIEGIDDNYINWIEYRFKVTLDPC